VISKPAGDLYRPSEDRTAKAASWLGGAASTSLAGLSSGVNRGRALIGVIYCGMLALVSGCAALAAGLAGNIPMAGLALGCSLLFGWATLRNARVAFPGAGSNTSGSWSTPDRASSGSRQASWASHDDVARDFGTGARGESVICYSRARLFVSTVALFPLCMLVVFVCNARFHWHAPINVLILVVLTLALLAGIRPMLMGMKSDLTALAWDERQILVRTLSTSRVVPWEAVEGVLITQRVLRLMGIPIRRTATGLVIRLRYKGSSRRMVIPGFALSVRPAEAAAMLQDAALRRARYRAPPAMPIPATPIRATSTPATPMPATSVQATSMPATSMQDAGGGDRPHFGQRITARSDPRTSVPNATASLDSVATTRGFGEHDRVAAAPRGFGKKGV
jgi:hypothetical protein